MNDIIDYTKLSTKFFYHIAKSVYELVVEQIGDDDGNAGRDLTIPFMCDGWFKCSTGYSAEYFDPWNTYVYTDYMFNINIDGNYNTENFIKTYIPVWSDSKYGNISIEDAYNHIRSSSTTGSYLDNAINSLDYAQAQAETFKLRLNDGMSQQTIFSQYTNYGTQYYTDIFTYNDNQTILDSFTRYNLYQKPPVDVLNITKIRFDSRAASTNLNIAHSSNPITTDIHFDRTFNLFTITDNNTATNVYNNNNSEYNNSFTYTTNEGDTIYVYYGDNYIDLGIGAGGGGIGAGGIVGFNYNDLKLIMDDIIDDLKINSPALDIPDGYQFPTFEEIKYEDMGDFYITPLHQYDKLPVAPTFDGTVDLGDYPKYIGSAAQTFLNFMPAGISALLAACFIGCVIIRNLKR